MPTLSITYSVSLAEYMRVVATIDKKRHDNSLMAIADSIGASAFWPACVAVFIRMTSHSDWWFVVFIVGSGLNYSFRSVYAGKVYQRHLLSLPDVIDTEQTLTISSTGVVHSSARATSQYRWDYFSGVEVVANMVTFKIGTAPGIMAPQRAFRDLVDAERFVEVAQSFWRGEGIDTEDNDASVWPPKPL